MLVTYLPGALFDDSSDEEFSLDSEVSKLRWSSMWRLACSWMERYRHIQHWKTGVPGIAGEHKRALNGKDLETRWAGIKNLRPEGCIRDDCQIDHRTLAGIHLLCCNDLELEIQVPCVVMS